jgi:hypothetical protein
MCYNKDVSIITYIFGIVSSYKLFELGYKPEAIFYAWVIQMQLVEYFLWSNQPCLDPKIIENNKTVSKLGMLINHLEPIVLWLAILYYYPKNLSQNINLFMFIFVIASILYTINIQNECTTVSEESTPHLHWRWNNGSYASIYYVYFLLTLVILSLYGLPSGRGYINASIAAISFGISYYIYGDRKTVGAMWCFAAAFAPFLLQILYSI